MVAGEDVTRLASMCKLKAGRLSREVTDSCLQYWGGMGFTNDVLVSRMYRYVSRMYRYVSRVYRYVSRMYRYVLVLCTGTSVACTGRV